MTPSPLPPPTYGRGPAITLVVTVLGMLLGIYLTSSILTTRGNSLAELAKFVAAIGFVLGFFQPRPSMYLLVLSTALLDLIKRLLVLYHPPSMIDLFYVLGISPLLLGGIALGCLVGGLFGRYPMDKRHLGLLSISVLYILVIAAFAVKNQGLQDAAKMVANSASYSLLLFVIPVLYHSVEEIWKLMRFAILVFLPVAAYGIWQSLFGLSAFEIEYLNSGLTIMVKELDDLRPRPFSTLNSAGALGFVSAMLAMLCLVPSVVGRSHPEIGKHRALYAIASAFFLVTATLTMVRGSHLVWIFTLGALYAFPGKRRTLGFYGAGLSGYAFLVLASDWLMTQLPKWDAQLAKGSDLMTQATRIQTFGDRLRSFNSLKDPQTWSWFGTDRYVFSHDAITSALVDFGAVPMALAGLIGGFALIKLHRTVLSLRRACDRRLCSLLLGLALSIFAGGALLGVVGKIFPINTYLWLVLGALFQITLFRDPVSVETPATTQPARRPVFGRFGSEPTT